jgi:hypothetical protein
MGKTGDELFDLILEFQRFQLRNVNKIKSTMWRSYFSFFSRRKSCVPKHRDKDFSTKKKWKRTSQMVDFILLSFLSEAFKIIPTILRNYFSFY